jgi:hypothetical protein
MIRENVFHVVVEPEEIALGFYGVFLVDIEKVVCRTSGQAHFIHTTAYQ